MNFLHEALDYVLHIDAHLAIIIAQYGTLTYFILFALIFCVMGIILTPILPGDSLLFATGALTANEATGLNIYLLFFLLASAAILGNLFNYQVGKWIGPKVSEGKIKLVNQKYLLQAHSYFEKYGGRTVMISCFIPIVRTFAPFVAGVSRMSFSKYALFAIIGATSWAFLFLFAGFWFGNISFVREHFSSVIIIITLITFIPTVIAGIQTKKRKDD
jgi:membrane-associated protein